MQTVLYFASILLTGALAGFLAAYAWRQRSVPGSRAYAGLALGECLLALAEILSMLSPTQAQALFWFKVRYLSLAAVPVLWLVFALEYSGHKDWLSRRLLAGMFVIPVITQVLLWSNNLHGLWVRQEVGFHQNGPFWIAETGARLPGPGFLAHSFYGLILLLAGIVLLLVAAWRMRRLYRRQALLVAGAASTAFAFALIATLNLIPQTGFNPFTPGIGLSVLLIALAVFRFQFLKRTPAEGAGSKVQALETQAGRSLAVFLLVFLLMAMGIAAVGYLSFQNYQSRFRAQVEGQLASIARLKADELENWRAERMGDAQAMRQNPVFAALAERYLENPSDTQAQAQIQAWLDSLRSVYHYDRVFLLDTAGVERVSSPAPPEPVAAHLAQEAAAILSAGQVTLIDFHRDAADGPIYLSLLVPILAEQDGNRPLGILVLRIDPGVYLYPYLQQWPVPSASAETLLVRRDGADVLFLNELRFQANTALNLRVPLEKTEVLAVKAALGQVGIVEGVDYRGAPVIGAVRAVPGSPWFLVARMDTAEVYAPLQERLWLTRVFFGALIAASGAGLGLVWRQQRARYDREQVEAAQALRESEERYRLLFQNLTAGFALHEIILGDDGQPCDYRFLEVNPTFEQLTGLRAEALIGRTVHEVLPGVEPYWIGTYGRVATAGVSIQFENYSQESGRHYQVTAYAPGPGRFATIFHDITERKRAEEALRASESKFKAVFENAPIGISLLDTERNLFESNLTLERITRTTKDGLLAGAYRGRKYLRPDGTEMPPGEFASARAINENQPVRDVESGVVTEDGQVIWTQVSAAPLGLPAGRVVVITQDITERKRQEAQILAAQTELQRLLAEADQSRRALLSVVEDQKKAEEEILKLNAELERRVHDRTAQLQATNKELEAFAYSVSHDLRAPLRGIDGWSLALAEDYYGQLDERARQYLGRVRSEAQRMGQLIDDLLQLSRVTRAGMQTSAVDLTALAQTVVARLQTTQPGRQVEVLIQPGLTARGDARLLEVVLTNLLGNAWKFTGPRSLARIEFGQMEVEGRLAFFVRDNGAGFDMAYAQKLFGAFQRLHRASEFPGTGIGLATVQRIVHRHGGRVWAEAHIDQGALFYFTLEA